MSISFSITFRTLGSSRWAALYWLNGRMRALGLRPCEVGASPLGDEAKWLASRALSRLARMVTL